MAGNSNGSQLSGGARKPTRSSSDIRGSPVVGAGTRACRKWRRLDVAAVPGCQKALASGSMIGLLPDMMAAAKEEACGSRRCM